MITQIKKASVMWTVAAILALSLLAGCSSLAAPADPGKSHASSDSITPAGQDTTSTQKQEDLKKDSESIVYNNTEYGFNFTLPESWKGYTIIAEKWEGLVSGESQGDTASITGPMLSIRHPMWTSGNPRQDIPIMIFTLAQWNSLQQDKFHIGAAPIGPSELGRNSRYVFALPARYNYAFPAGYEEVEDIISNNPLTAADIKKDVETNGIEKYINLLGLSKEKLILALDENPVSIDEGGLEFKKAEIRVWFKDYGKGMAASEIFTQRKDIDFDGAKIGDKISSFKKALGEPISDENGEAHFKYKDIFLSFNYDTQSEDTICVYFLSENY